MTDNQERYFLEIAMYEKRRGKYPTISQLADMFQKHTSTVSITVARMVKNGDLEYVGEWVNGKSRQVKTC